MPHNVEYWRKGREYYEENGCVDRKHIINFDFKCIFYKKLISF